MSKLTIIRGLPGSGKSTLAKYLSVERLAVICEADQYFTDENGEYNFDPSKLKDAHEWCINKAKTALNRGENVIVANTFVKKWEADSYRKLGTPIQVIETTGDYGSVHDVPAEAIQRMKDNWEEYPSTLTPLCN